MDDQFINDLVRIARLVLRPYVGLDRPALLAGMAGQAPLEDEHYLLVQVAQALPDRSVFFERWLAAVASASIYSDGGNPFHFEVFPASGDE